MMTDALHNPKAGKAASVVSTIIFGSIFILFFCLFIALGIWQVQRLAWKTGLISRVEERVHLPARPAPARSQWATVSAACCEYLPVRITGRFLNDKEVFVNALTAQGAGYWLLTPLQTADGAVTFINRGFVPMDKKPQAARAAGLIHGETTLSGLLRITEKDGFFPRRNDPGANVWYTRELPAMAKARGLADVAPYFIDADKTPNTGGVPVGGLTVISFPNNHLSYAVTWFVLAAGVLLGAGFVFYSSGTKRSHQ